MRGWKVLTSRRSRVTLWSSLAAMLVVGSAAGLAWVVNAPAYTQGVRAIEELRENPPECFGAAVVLDGACEGTDFGDTILPAPGFAGVDRPTDEQCFVQLNDARPVSCEFGSDAADAPRIALVGDSHAYQLLSTFQRMADENGWHLTTYFKGACPWNTTPLSTPGAFGAACTEWRNGVRSALADDDLDAVFTAAIATTPYSSAGYDSSYDAAVAGYREAWSEVLDRGIPVVTVVDNPVWETDPNKCLRTRAMSECDGPRSELLVADDPLRDAAAGLVGCHAAGFHGRLLRRGGLLTGRGRGERLPRSGPRHGDLRRHSRALVHARPTGGAGEPSRSSRVADVTGAAAIWSRHDRRRPGLRPRRSTAPRRISPRRLSSPPAPASSAPSRSPRTRASGTTPCCAPTATPSRSAQAATSRTTSRSTSTPDTRSSSDGTCPSGTTRSSTAARSATAASSAWAASSCRARSSAKDA